MRGEQSGRNKIFNKGAESSINAQPGEHVGLDSPRFHSRCTFESATLSEISYRALTLLVIGATPKNDLQSVNHLNPRLSFPK
jgi:hypothetical protein